MNKKLISIVTGTIFGCLTTTTSYAWPASSECQAARTAHGIIMDMIQHCKNFVPKNYIWRCGGDLEFPNLPTRNEATIQKRASFAMVQYHCKDKPVHILVRGADLHGANGISFDSANRMHIATLIGSEIVVMDTKDGAIEKRLGPAEGVNGPGDLAFRADGSLYWTSLITGKVGRRTPDGVKSEQMVKIGVNAITFSDDGRLFVTLNFLGDALYEIDPDFINPPRLIAQDLGFLIGMDWGPDGYLYGALWLTGEVVRIDVDNIEVDKGNMSVVTDGLGLPAAVKFDSHGRLHVVDHEYGDVIRVDITTGDKTVIASGMVGMDNLAFDSYDRLFITNTQNGSVTQIKTNKKQSKQKANKKQRAVSFGGLIAPQGVAILPRTDGEESVFVADFSILHEFDSKSGEELSISRHMFTKPGLISPFTVSADGENLVLSSSFDSKVQVWNPKTQTELELYDFNVPLNAIRFDGDLIVAELGTSEGAAQVLRANGEERTVLFDATAGLVMPVGLAATENALWVGDYFTGKIWQVIIDGIVLSTPLEIASGLLAPEGMAVEQNGNLLVVETGAKRLVRIDVDRGTISEVAGGLDVGLVGMVELPPSYTFNGVAVDSSGTIYVTGDKANVLYRIQP
jgi:sugar lactone lactonase YvrE